MAESTPLRRLDDAIHAFLDECGDLDEDTHPTGAWTVGEHLDSDTAAALKAMIDGGRV